MTRTFAALRRLGILTLVWGLAVFYAVQAVAAMVQHRQLSCEVNKLHSEYQQELENYSDELAHGDRIRNDEQYQIEMLKQRFGYSEPDETPVIVMPPQN